MADVFRGMEMNTELHTVTDKSSAATACPTVTPIPADLYRVSIAFMILFIIEVAIVVVAGLGIFLWLLIKKCRDYWNNIMGDLKTFILQY